MEIECPECKKTNEVEGDDLPANACDDIEFECSYCQHNFMIGWFADVELR